MTKPEIAALVTRLSWLDTIMACAFRRACGIDRQLTPMDDDEPSEFYASLMRQRYGALDNPRRNA